MANSTSDRSQTRPQHPSATMNKLRLYLRLARLVAVLLLGMLLASAVALTERLRRHDLLDLRQRLTCWFLGRLSHALPFDVEVQGKLPGEPMLWASNHVSWTDIPLLGQLLPLSFLSKAEVRSWPLAGWLAHKAGTLFIRRGSGDSALLARQLQRYLQGGHALLIFPEGTTTDGQQVRTFHGRLLTGSIEAGMPVQPVAIRYLRAGQPDLIAPFIGDDDLPSHLLRLFAQDRGTVQIQLLEPIASHGLERNALARQAQRAVQVALFGESEEREQVAA